MCLHIFRTNGEAEQSVALPANFVKDKGVGSSSASQIQINTTYLSIGSIYLVAGAGFEPAT